jgi:hypothetical protein
VSQFAVGDKVRCVDGSPHGCKNTAPKAKHDLLKFGTIYKVKEAHLGDSEIRVEEVAMRWRVERFVLATGSSSNNRLLLLTKEV